MHIAHKNTYIHYTQVSRYKFRALPLSPNLPRKYKIFAHRIKSTLGYKKETCRYFLYFFLVLLTKGEFSHIGKTFHRDTLSTYIHIYSNCAKCVRTTLPCSIAAIMPVMCAALTASPFLGWPPIQRHISFFATKPRLDTHTQRPNAP